jgi:hypothetical protein
MNISGFSNDGLSKMYQAILDALEKDDTASGGQEKPYGVREYQDWKQWADTLEAELTKREIQFVKVPW